MLEFFKLEPQRQYNTGYILPDRTPFDYQLINRKETAILTFSNKWEIPTNSILVKTISTYLFKSKEFVVIDSKRYMIQAIYTDDLEQDLNSPEFKSKRTYTYLALGQG